MSDLTPADIQFLNELHDVIAKNLANEQFGVTELAGAMSMSRSNLLRKVKKSTNLPVNQLIREARLKRAMELLQSSGSNVSEVSHQVGFNSTSYFIKCFREYYGYPPGEASNRNPSESALPEKAKTNYWKKRVWIGSAVLTIILIGILFFYYNRTTATPLPERSIVVLPFKNESSDSTNVYLINGLMESTLNNLQKIEDLRVLSRTSAEKYRNTSKSIPELATELEASYFIEGSGQKIGDQILLTIQLIEGKTDRHIWSKQYRRKATDIFTLQQEIAQNIAEEIEVAISPEVKQRIEKIPTENLEAYNEYLKGKELYYQSTGESLNEALGCFKKAVSLDSKFALAYAHIVMTEYYLDMFLINKAYTDEIDVMAEQAMVYDPKSGESLTAKALAYAHKKDYKQAVLYLEKALEYYPNSGMVLYFLTEFYSLFVPDQAKFLEYALRGAKSDLITQDSVGRGFKYFQASNAMIQAGFIDDGIRYVDKSLAYDSNAYFTRYIHVLFRFAKNQDPEMTKQSLLKEFKKDTTRVDIVKYLANLCYMSRDYKGAFQYYEIFIRQQEQLQLEIFKEENLCIAIVLRKMGKLKEAEEYRNRFKAFAESSESTIYKHALLASYYADAGDTKRTLDELNRFAEEDNYTYWILMMDHDPVFDSIKNSPEFKHVMEKIKKKFLNRQDKIQADLESKGLYPFETYLPL
jgi:TolB-like protein/AraC-like DNA-binding protein